MMSATILAFPKPVAIKPEWNEHQQRTIQKIQKLLTEAVADNSAHTDNDNILSRLNAIEAKLDRLLA